MATYPKIRKTSFGEITVGNQTHTRDIYIRADGRVKKRKKALAKEVYGTSHKIGPRELKKVCKDPPEVLFIGTGQYGIVELTAEGERFLAARDIACRALPTPEVIEAYNDCDRRKAALIHVTC